MKILESLSYNSVNPHDLLCVNEKIEKIISDFKTNLPIVEGMIIRPLLTQRCKRKLTKQIVRKYGNLQLYQKRGKKRGNWRFQNRVGKKAESYCKV